MLAEDNYFFRMSAYTEPLLAYYAEHPEFVQPESARNEVVKFVEQGLQDLSISRSSFDWGIPIPWDPTHVLYVWIDALLNYATAVGYGVDDPAAAARFARTWPADVHLVGKDILRFHAVIWPAMLMAAGLPLPKQVFAHGWLLVGGEKMSKSKLTGIAPAEITDHFGSDALRYYLLRTIAFGQDGSFSWEHMSAIYSSELANGLGNLASRVTAMVGRYFDGVLPSGDAAGPPEKALADGLASDGRGRGCGDRRPPVPRRAGRDRRVRVAGERLPQRAGAVAGGEGSGAAGPAGGDPGDGRRGVAGDRGAAAPGAAEGDGLAVAAARRRGGARADRRAAGGRRRSLGPARPRARSSRRATRSSRGSTTRRDGLVWHGVTPCRLTGRILPPPEPLRVPVADSHCHLDIGRDGAPPSVDEALAAARAVGVTTIIQIGCDLASAAWAAEMASAYEDIWAGVALHPNEAPKIDIDPAGDLEAAYALIDDLAALPQVVAVGETGLDYFRTGEEGRAVQQASFRRHIAMAKAHDKTLVIHDRDAHADVLRILTRRARPSESSFIATPVTRRWHAICADRGYYLSFAGTVTFANATHLREALAMTPLDRVLVETDAPYLTPMPYRGRPNASYLIPITIRAMAAVTERLKTNSRRG